MSPFFSVLDYFNPSIFPLIFSTLPLSPQTFPLLLITLLIPLMLTIGSIAVAFGFQ
jgi:hypothetical protein